LATTSIRSGDLDRRVAIQQASITYSPSGQPIEGWTTLAERWAAYKPLLGQERIAAEQWIGLEQVQFTLRWDATIKDVAPKDRVIFPAADASSSPIDERSIFDIFAVHEIGRHVALEIQAVRLT